MAKSKTAPKNIPINNAQQIWFSDLNNIPAENKNELWAAMALYYMKKNSRLFLDPVRAAAYRSTDSLQLEERIYKEMVDPTTPMGGGGQASYFSADWKANPSYLKLKSIVKAKLSKSGKQLEVNMTDKYAKTRKMEHNYTILYRDLFRNIINEYAPMVGLPPISKEQDPFKWVKNTFQNEEAKGQPTTDLVDNYIDLIKNQITDSKDLAMYNEMIYKGDYEKAFELGMQYYLFSLNKYKDRYESDFIDDVMHFNKACGEWYTDEITGRPVVERFVGEKLWVSNFKRKDGEDLLFYFTEYDITFADFAKTMGRNMTEQQLKKVFDYQKAQGSTSGMMTWANDLATPNSARDNSMIRIGRAGILSQDISVYMGDVEGMRPMPVTWKPMEGDGKKIEKYYNVWYSFYYVPPTTNSINNSDFAWQSQYIFDIKKNQDQQRYGEDGRYSKPPLVIYDNSNQASFTDITQYYMPKIHFASHKFQNCLVNDLDAVALADDFIGGLLGAVDESNKINPGNPNEATGGNGRDAMMEQWKMIQQGGKGFLKMTDKHGQLIIDPSKLVIPIKNGYLDKAEKYLAVIAIQYDEMVRVLGQSNASTGETIKPRTPVAAIQESLKSSEDSVFDIQKTYEAFLKIYGERMIQYIIQIAQEATKGYTKRWEEFLDNVGYANGLAIEGMADVPPESVGLTVEYTDTEAKKQFLMDLATEYVKGGMLDETFLDLLLSVDNWKMGFTLFRIGVKQRKKEAQEEAAIQQQYIMQQKQMDLQIAQVLAGAKTDGKLAEIQKQAEMQNMINQALNDAKYKTQSALKSETTNNRITETNSKLDKQAEIDSQKPLQEV